jgi:alpha-D-ribose 1-methylphosphonate 5-triphosphate synthase subunit PhnG
MKRKRRTEILIRGDRSLAAQLALQIEQSQMVRMVADADHGLVMIKMRETAQNTRFYLGEMFVTECKVSVSGHTGIGIVQGDEPELAYQLAVIDGAYVAELEQTSQWLKLLEAEEANIRRRQQDEHKRLLLTKVNFETMQEEDQ